MTDSTLKPDSTTGKDTPPTPSTLPPSPPTIPTSSPAPPSSLSKAASTATTLLIRTLDTTTTAWSELSAASLTKWTELDKKRKGLGNDGEAWRNERVEKLLECAWSVENSTQVGLNVSLNQVGPLLYEVVPPSALFERRVPNLPFTLVVRSYTSSSTAYTPWSVSWPILALTGPTVAATSLLAIPFVALAVGGSALASLTGFGSTVVAGSAAVSSTALKTTATLTSLAARASRVPYAGKVKTKLMDAAKKNLPVVVGEGLAGGGTGVVRYFLRDKKEEVEVKEEGKKGVEVDVTGFKLEDVLKCETGKKKVDKVLREAFDALSIRDHRFKSSDNPVLRITGGPELEERGSKQFLIFYPFAISLVPALIAIPTPLEDLPPVEAEIPFVRDAKVVETTEEAEQLAKELPVWGEGAGDTKGSTLV